MYTLWRYSQCKSYFDITLFFFLQIRPQT
uniref:Uncharacterized protein n=1 Tax=Anguilla anguilla TaxID=7936 RepID=A0A0E9QDK2_ANGAN